MLMADEKKNYLDPERLNDSLLQEYVTEEILNEVDRFIESMANTFNLAPEKIKTPLTFRMERLATLYAYLLACEENAFTGNNSTSGRLSANGDDSFSLKRKIFKSEFDQLYERITDKDITGEGPPGAVNIVIGLGRA